MPDNLNYMILGYVVMAVVLGGMVAWTYWRFKALHREAHLLDQMEAEERADPVAAAVGAMEHQARPEAAAPGITDRVNPNEPRARQMPQ